eukprot:TRINITY_DN4609_c0_g1_i2.p1 TRINITY_DN4609_c0_g1~~TRINITY_DN4609_c0_g1_i2.p1  ORF type:complete len:1061 (+),score=448.35 TRINITY_DN4609_c0_g1_i2:109-3291(+)
MFTTPKSNRARSSVKRPSHNPSHSLGSSFQSPQNSSFLAPPNATSLNLVQAPSSTIKSPSNSLNHSISLENLNAKFNFLLKNDKFFVDFHSNLPKEVKELLQNYGGKGVDARIDERGYCFLASTLPSGFNLFIWKVSRSSESSYPQCLVLEAPDSQFPLRSKFCSVVQNESDKTLGLLIITEEGTIRFWNTLDSKNPTEAKLDLESGNLVTDLASVNNETSFLIGTLSGSLIQVHFDEDRMMNLTIVPLHSNSSSLYGLGTLLWGRSNSNPADKSIKRIQVAYSEENYIDAFVLTRVSLTRVALNSQSSNRKVLFEVNLVEQLGNSMRNVRSNASDFQLEDFKTSSKDESKGYLLVLWTQNHRTYHGIQEVRGLNTNSPFLGTFVALPPPESHGGVYYGERFELVIGKNDEGALIFAKDLLWMKRGPVDSPTDHFNLSEGEFILGASGVKSFEKLFILTNRNGILSFNLTDSDSLSSPELKNASKRSKTTESPVVYQTPQRNSQKGRENNNEDSNNGMEITSQPTSNSVPSTPSSSSASTVPNATVPSISGFKSSALGNDSFSNAFRAFLSNEPKHKWSAELNKLTKNSMEDSISKLGESILNASPTRNLHWAEGDLDERTSSALLGQQIEEKKNRLNFLLEFLRESNLHSVIGQDSKKELVRFENKMNAILNLRSFQNDNALNGVGDSQILSKAFDSVFEERGMRLAPGLTVQDYYYSEVGKMEQLLPHVTLALKNDINNLSKSSEAKTLSLLHANEIFVIFAKSFSPETINSIVNGSQNYVGQEFEGLFKIAASFASQTLDHIAGNEEAKEKIYGQLAIIADSLLASYSYMNAESFEERRSKLIRFFVEQRKDSLAITLAEKYRDFIVLIDLLEGNDEKLEQYMDHFREYRFDEVLFKNYMDKGNYVKLLNQPDRFDDELAQFLAGYPSYSWLHDIKTKDFDRASKTLHNNAAAELKIIKRKRTLLSLSKLSCLASSHEEAKETIEKNQCLLYLLDVQEKELKDFTSPLSPEEVIRHLVDSKSKELTKREVLLAIEVWSECNLHLKQRNNQRNLERNS